MQGLVQKCMGFGRSERVQFLLLGLDQVGKTTLLYRLKLGSDWEDMRKDLAQMRQIQEDGMTEDPGYHYEEFSRCFKHGMWDVPGTEAMRRMWFVFYREIKIHVVAFVVDASDSDERIELARRHLHTLMSEDELRFACFCVIVNQRPSSQPGTRGKSAKVPLIGGDDDMHYKLGLHHLHSTCEWRLRRFNINILALRGASDKDWQPVLEFARETLMDSRGYGLKL